MEKIGDTKIMGGRKFKLMAVETVKQEAEKAKGILQRNGYTRIQTFIIPSYRKLHNRLLPTDFYQIWAFKEAKP